MHQVIEDIKNEREHQINLGWTHFHDDHHKHGELAMAAACYALPSMVMIAFERHLVKLWPFDTPMKRSNDHRKNLVKAATMLVAEIERIDRKEIKDAPIQG